MKSWLILSLLMLAGLQTQAQEDEPKFRITHTAPYTTGSCGAETGVQFLKGYLYKVEAGQWVEVMLFFQRKDGSFQKFHFEHQGSGVISFNYADCKYTGNYYVFVCNANDDDCKFPTEAQVIEKHQQTISTQQPHLKVTRIIPNPKCPEEGVIIETGFVYSPTGGKVEINLFVEKKDKSWRKQLFVHQGTGLIKLDINDCNLTGKYKAVVTYASNN